MTGHHALTLFGAALLYAGPVLAGWSQLHSDVIVPFTLIFMAFVTLSRHDLAHPPEGWRAAAVWVHLLLVALVQLVLVGLCFALGLGLAWLTGPLTPGPVWPLALSALSLPLAWRSGRTDPREMDALIDDMTRQLEAMNADFATLPPDPQSGPDLEGAALGDLCDEPATPRTLHRILDTALDPGFALPRCGSSDVADALAHILNQGDGDVLRRMATGGMALIQADPAMVCEMPLRSHLEQRANDLAAAGDHGTARDLRAFAAMCNDD